MIAVLMLAGVIDSGLAGPAKVDKAVEARYTKAYTTCLNTGDAAAGQNLAMQQCGQDEFARQDAALNTTYAATIKRLTPAKQTKLRGFERTWANGRDSGCRASAHKEGGGGTIEGLLYISCRVDTTIRRSIWLEAYK